MIPYPMMPDNFAYLVSPPRTVSYEQIETAVREIWGKRADARDDNVEEFPHVDFGEWGIYLAFWKDANGDNFKWMEHGTPSNEEYHDMARAIKVVYRDIP